MYNISSCSLTFSLLYSANLDPHDTDKMAAEFLMQFNNMAFTEGQCLAFQFSDKKLLVITIKEIEGEWTYPISVLFFFMCHKIFKNGEIGLHF